MQFCYLWGKRILICVPLLCSGLFNMHTHTHNCCRPFSVVVCIITYNIRMWCCMHYWRSEMHNQRTTTAHKCIIHHHRVFFLSWCSSWFVKCTIKKYSIMSLPCMSRTKRKREENIISVCSNMSKAVLVFLSLHFARTHETEQERYNGCFFIRTSLFLWNGNEIFQYVYSYLFVDTSGEKY